MIYICVPTHNAAQTVGLVLWKIRQVFAAFPREYHLLVADDGSSDATPEVLEPYQRALPLSVIRHEKRLGYAASVETLFRESLLRSDRPKRDFAVTIHADFSVSPAVLPDLVRSMESGADLVVAESPMAEATVGRRLVRKWAPWLLKPGVNVPGLRDFLSGVCAIRLATLRYLLNDSTSSVLTSRGTAAWAELLARSASVARQISAVEIAPAEQAATERAAPSPPSALSLALELFQTGRRLRIPAPASAVQRAS